MANNGYRDAVRILFLLVEGAVSNGSASVDPAYPYRFEGETRLQALDFWVRYPDYLADELLVQYEETGDTSFIVLAKGIIDRNEPSERSIPMLRRYFGAYEPLDQVLTTLTTAGLTKAITLDHPTANPQHFLLSQAALELRDRILREQPIFEWYGERAKLVLRVSKGMGGSNLKKRQHERKAYHDARIDDLIPTMAEAVRAKLEKLDA